MTSKSINPCENADYFIKKLGLKKHPEGGYFRETFRSNMMMGKDVLPVFFEGTRSFSTAIYFLLRGNDFSSFHRLKSDEVWHFYLGSSLTIRIIETNGRLHKVKLGKNIKKNEALQAIIPSGRWFAASVDDKTSFSLVGCTVSPGFDFNDFELGERETLLEAYPQHKEMIVSLTRPSSK
jgi:predicted cupin superfamily sugar epimerase